MAIDVEAVIEKAIERNQELSDAAIKAQSAAMSAAAGRIFAPAGFVATVPALRQDPPVFTPNTELSVDFRNAYQQAFADFTPTVLAAVVDYIARFFPGALATVIDDWIQNAITNGGTGLPATIETAIWDRARGREIIEARRLEQEAASQFAGRGFIMPPGAMAARMLEIQQDATNKSVTISRDRAIKAAEMEIENIRFAVEQGLKVRLAVIGGVGDYIRAWMKPADDAVEYAKALVAAKEKLWNEASAYYRALIAEAEMKLRAQEITQRSRDSMVGLDVQSYTEFTKSQTNAALVVATQLGQAAAGALNATGVQVGQQDQRVGALT
jgi:hypothetical protein